MRSRVVTCCKSLFPLVLLTVAFSSTASAQLSSPGRYTEQQDALLRRHDIEPTPEAMAKGLRSSNSAVCAICLSRLSRVGTDAQIEAVKAFILREPPKGWTSSLEFQALGALDQMCRRATRENAKALRPLIIERADRLYRSQTELVDKLRCTDLLVAVGGPVHVEPILEAFETAAHWDEGKAAKRGIYQTATDYVRGGLEIAGQILPQGKETAPFARLVTPLERLMRDASLEYGLRRKATLLLAYVPDAAAEKALRTMAESNDDDLKAEARKRLDAREHMLKPLAAWRAAGAPRD